MSEVGVIAQAFTSLQSATHLAKALIGMRDTAMIDAKVIELRESLIEAQSTVFQAQSHQSALIQEVHNLKEQIVKMENWEKEKERYQLTEPWTGCFVYALKEACKGTEPPHWICEHCYQDGRKSMLHNHTLYKPTYLTIIKCSHCKFENEIQSHSEREYAKSK